MSNIKGSIVSRRSLTFLLVLFLITPLALARRNVILGDWYWPKGSKNWVQRGNKTTFAPGDYLIIMDSRVTLGFGSNRGDIPYYLNATSDNEPYLTHGPIQVSELVTNRVTGPGGTSYPFFQSEFEGHAVRIPIDKDSYSGTLTATFFYIDPEKRAQGLSVQESLLEPPVEIPGIADIVRPVDTTPPPPPPPPKLSIQSPPSSVLINNTFTLTAQLDGVNLTGGQTTTTYVWTQTPSAGVPAATVVGPSNLKTITYTAPGVEGTLTFKVTSKVSNIPDLDSSPITIAVVKQITQPPPSTGTPVGKPAGGNKPAQATINPVPTDVKVNVPFALSAWANDPDATVPTCDPVLPCPKPETLVPSVTGKWERIVNGVPQLLQDTKTFSPISAGENKLFDVTVTEANTGTYTYRFTVTDAVGVGNYYEVQITIGTGAPVNNGPVIKFATPPPSTVDVDTVVTLDASGSTTITGKDLQFTWTLKIDNNDLTFSNISRGKISFRVPLPAAGKKIVGTLTVKDVENKQVSQNFEINVSVPPIRALSFPEIRGIVSRQKKTDTETSSLDATEAPQFINFIAILNPAGEKGKSELISVRSVDADGNPLSDYYKSVGLGPDNVPFARQVEKMIPEEAQTDSQVVKLNSLSRLAGVGMLLDSTLPRMDAFDLSSQSGTDWVLPYLFKNSSREGLGRETFGIVAIQNTSNDDAEVQPQYLMRLGNVALQGQKFTAKPGGSRIIELADYFGLKQLNDPPGYATFTSNKAIQVLAFYGDNREMFTVPGVRKQDFTAVAVAPVAFRSNEWETVITVINGQNKDVKLTVQLLNNSPEFPVDLKGKEFSFTLKPGANDVTLAELIGKPVDVPFTALKLTAESSTIGGANVFAGSVLLKNTATGAESLWPLLNTGMSSFIFPHVVQGGEWQGAFTLSNLGSATASLKASGALLVRGDGGSLVVKAVDGIFSVPAGGIVAGPELSKFGISQQGEVLGGYLKVEPVNPTADVSLAPAGMLFHTKGKGGIIDGLSSLPVVK